MIRIAFIACLFFAVASADEEAPNLLEKLQLCNATGNACLKEAIQKAAPLFTNGIPEIGLKPLDPFLVDHATLDFNFGLVRAKVLLSNVYIHGMSKYEVLGVRSTPTDGRHHLEVDAAFPTLLFEGHYNLEGRLGGVLPLGGQGFFNVSMKGVTMTWNIDGHVENDRWILEHFIILPQVEDAKVYFEDLFNGNEEFNKAARAFVNENWRSLHPGMLPVAANAWDKIITEYLNTFFSKISYEHLFP